MDLLTTYAADAYDLADWLADAELNRDRNLRLMYLAGLGLNEYVAGDIYREVLDRRGFPDHIFTGPADRVGFLRNLMGY
jgi:hypothetical protein